MSNYLPIAAAVVTCRLQGKPIPAGLELARSFPCKECGAPIGFACQETSELCWRARLLSEKQWRAIGIARSRGRGAPGGFRDEIYTGFHVLGCGYTDPYGAQEVIRRMSKDVVAMVKTVLDRLESSGHLQNRSDV